MPTGQAHRCQDGQPSLDHGRAGDAISEGIYMRISPTFVILFGSPGYQLVYPHVLPSVHFHFLLESK